MTDAIQKTAEDFVTSAVMFRASDGKELKPDEYLRQFEKFVKVNPEHIEAIEILLKRPKDFHTEELKELRQKLASKPDNLMDKFNERNLRRAYDNQLADIISIIKHAAMGEELYSAQARINRAFARVRANIAFSPQQEKWLQLIREHLIQNLLLEREDFDTLPIFTREGMNFQRLDAIFDGQLDKIISEINEAVAT